MTACDSGVELVKDITTQLGASSEHPCAGEFQHQSDLNGEPDDTRILAGVPAGAGRMVEAHWYAEAKMIIYYTYEERGSCEVRSETGIDWVI